MTSVGGGATGGGGARDAASTDGGGRRHGVGWDAEVEGRPHWRGGACRAKGRRPQGKIEADPSEDVAVGEATGGGGRGNGGKRQGGRGARCHGGAVREMAKLEYFNP